MHVAYINKDKILIEQLAKDMRKKLDERNKKNVFKHIARLEKGKKPL